MLDPASGRLEDVLRGSEPFTTVLRAVLERCGALVIGTTPPVRFSGRTYPKLAQIVRALCAVAGRRWWLLPLLSPLRQPRSGERSARDEQTVCVAGTSPMSGPA